MSDKAIRLTLSSAEQTTKIAHFIADRLLPADILLMEGDIGAGKTHFARSVIQHLLPEPEDVPSPTFTLVQIYDAKESEIWHADLYRLASPDDIVELGLVDAFEESICLIEWPDRLAELAPRDALSLSFSMTPTPGERVLEISWTADKWSEKLCGVADV